MVHQLSVVPKYFGHMAPFFSKNTCWYQPDKPYNSSEHLQMLGIRDILNAVSIFGRFFSPSLSLSPSPPLSLFPPLCLSISLSLSPGTQFRTH
jgi:hypothetical protein